MPKNYINQIWKELLNEKQQGNYKDTIRLPRQEYRFGFRPPYIRLKRGKPARIDQIPTTVLLPQAVLKEIMIIAIEIGFQLVFYECRLEAFCHYNIVALLPDSVTDLLWISQKYVDCLIMIALEPLLSGLSERLYQYRRTGGTHKSGGRCYD